MKISKELKKGNMAAIPINEKQYTFGRIISFPFMEFYNYILEKEDIDNFDPSLLLKNKPIFTVLIHKSCVSKKHWKIIGFNDTNLPEVPPVFIQDAFNPSDIKILQGTTSLVKARFEDVRNMERQAIWESDHIEQRIKDHIEGKPNITYEFFRAKKP